MMKINLSLRTLLVAAVGLLISCQSPKAVPSGDPSAARATRDNCYSLLHELLAEQKDVGILRFIKREKSDVKDLVKRIAAASGTG